jgi:hypothetical protein
MTDLLTLSREPETLDAALYSASCLAASAEDRCATIMVAIVDGDEFYRVEDGRVGPSRDNATGYDWSPCYTIEART